MKNYIKALLMGILFIPAAAVSGEATEAYAGGVTVTSKALAAEMSSYVSTDMKAKGGWFIIFDAESKAFVRLKPSKLDKGAHIHRLGETQFLSWGEFKDDNGLPYMLDFYFDLNNGRLEMSSELSIYSVGGKKRYDWDESGPIMKKKSAKNEP